MNSGLYDPLPEDLLCPGYDKVFDVGVWDYDDDETVGITTLPPPRKGHEPTDGYCQWIARKDSAEKILNQPGFPKAVPQPRNGEVPCHIVPTPEMGVGLYAAQHICAGELIFAERPLLVVPVTATGVRQRVTGSRYEAPKEEDATLKKITMDSAEVRIKDAISRMQKGSKASHYLALANAQVEDGRGPLFGILRTNGYQIDGLYDGPTNSNILKGYVGVCRVGSRINHSCQPNVKQEFDLESFSFLFKARRDIMVGEQLFYSYVSIYKPAADRQRDLTPYGFTCLCASCVNATHETDMLRAECNLRIYSTIRLARIAAQAKTLDKRVLDDLVNLYLGLVREGLTMARNFPALLMAIRDVLDSLDMRKEAQEWNKALCRYY